MIGFSNPFYHPSDQLFFFARNIQRHLMRAADGVTFISRFGQQSAFAECPDLDPARMHVVYCGADPHPLPGALKADRDVDRGLPLIACLASTFWHKNRTHAIATFAMLAKHHGYPGRLVIAGPQPYYGRSLDDEDALLAELPPDVSARVERWGHIDDDEKWWLLQNAQVVLYPSIVEGFGLVPFEAAAVGTPCLVNDATAPGELLGDTPAVVASWEPLDWSEHVARLVEQPAEADELARTIRQIGTDLTWERCANRTWQAIDHALAAPRRSLHHDDGGGLARVARPRAASTAGLRTRFDAARAIPGLRRRLGGLTNRLSDRTGHGRS
jgi:glycosyltransferase involved in cell wall biosynthesis